jgi:hypothetical protein
LKTSRYRGKTKVDLQNQFISAPAATSNADLDYWRSIHRERKAHNIEGQTEIIVSQVRTDPNFQSKKNRGQI